MDLNRTPGSFPFGNAAYPHPPTLDFYDERNFGV